jgi:hypothetical protein
MQPERGQVWRFSLIFIGRTMLWQRVKIIRFRQIFDPFALGIYRQGVLTKSCSQAS